MAPVTKGVMVAVAGVLLIGLLAPAGAAAGPARRTSGVAVAGVPARRIVTLPTGDRITVTTSGGRTSASLPVSPRPGSAPFVSIQADRHLYVIPHSAVTKIGRTMALSQFDVAPPSPPVVLPQFPMHILTVKGIDVAGRPTHDAFITANNVDDARKFVGGQGTSTGQAKFSVPDGHYSATGVFYTGRARHIVMLPQFTVSGDTTVTIDARRATVQPSVSTPRPASADYFDIGFGRTDSQGRGFSESELGFSDLLIYIAPAGAVTVGALHFYVRWRLTAPDGSYTYDVEFPTDGVIPAARHYVVQSDQLAMVRARYYSEVPGTGSGDRFAFLPWQVVDVGALVPLRQPRTRTEYLTGNPDIRWRQSVDSAVDGTADWFDGDRTYVAGQQSAAEWNKRPVHPGIDADLSPTPDNFFYCPACRIGDKLGLVVWPVTDNETGHLSFPNFAPGSESMALYQDGTKVASGTEAVGLFDVSPEPATYRLVQDIRKAPYTLSGDTHTEWMFRSSHRDGTGTLPPGWYCFDGTTDCGVLPLMMARYDLPLSLSDRHAAGATSFELTVDHVPGGRHVAVTSATVDVSNDGGTTWLPARVTDLGNGHFRVSYSTPARKATDGYVALRTTAVDAAGGRLAQTLLRAYALD